jgi:hypothetical protein
MILLVDVGDDLEGTNVVLEQNLRRHFQEGVYVLQEDENLSGEQADELYDSSEDKPRSDLRNSWVPELIAEGRCHKEISEILDAEEASEIILMRLQNIKSLFTEPSHRWSSA